MADGQTAVDGLLGTAPGAIEAYLRTALAAGGDVAATVARHTRPDAFELRDPHYIERLMRLKVLPAAIGPPLGVTILDLPVRFPLPAKISIRVLKPIDLRRRLGGDGTPEDAYDLVTSTMQRTLTRLDDERDLPVVG